MLESYAKEIFRRYLKANGPTSTAALRTLMAALAARTPNS